MYQEGLFDELYVCWQPPRQRFDKSNAGGTNVSTIDLDPNEADEDYVLESRIGI